MRVTIISLLALLLLSACYVENTTDNTNPLPEVPQLPEVPEEPDPEYEIKTVTVGPRLVGCVGVGPMRCMVVDGKNFYDGIEGFTYEEGYNYKLKIQVEDVENPPMDASSKKYVLVDILSKEEADESRPVQGTQIVTVGHPDEDCPGEAAVECLVVDGEDFYGVIEGFTYKAGFIYTLEVEVEDEKYTLVQVLSQDLIESVAPEPEENPYLCSQDSDCVVKNVGSCCGYYPRCVNINYEPDPEGVSARCAEEGLSSVCGWPDITHCFCVEAECVSMQDEDII